MKKTIFIALLALLPGCAVTTFPAPVYSSVYVPPPVYVRPPAYFTSRPHYYTYRHHHYRRY